VVLKCLCARSFDRYRTALKGTWKDKALPGAGQTYDLGSHLIDQALTLFGRPEKLTAFIQNVRGVGSPEVDDTVCPPLPTPPSPPETCLYLVYHLLALPRWFCHPSSPNSNSPSSHSVRSFTPTTISCSRHPRHLYQVWRGRPGGPIESYSHSKGHL